MHLRLIWGFFWVILPFMGEIWWKDLRVNDDKFYVGYCEPIATYGS